MNLFYSYHSHGWVKMCFVATYHTEEFSSQKYGPEADQDKVKHIVAKITMSLTQEHPYFLRSCSVLFQIIPYSTMSV